MLDVLEPEKEFKISSSIGSHSSLVAGVIGKIFLSAMNNGEVSGPDRTERAAQVHGELHHGSRPVHCGSWRRQGSRGTP